MEPIIDIIILSNTADVKYYNLLEKCIKSLKNSSNIKTNIIVNSQAKNLGSFGNLNIFHK